MEPWFGLAIRLDPVCSMLWAKDAREIVAEDGEECCMKVFFYRSGWLVGMWDGAKTLVPSWTMHA
jgi:hypothetical protein